MKENKREYVTRKQIRLKEYDYSQNGAYFITICVKDKKCLLGKIVGGGVLDAPQNILTKYGEIADKHINRMDNFYEILSVDKYVIMPNHIHMIIMIKGDGMSGTPSPTNSHLSRFVGTLKRFCNREYGENIWQRSFYDHIIRGKEDYEKIWEYIDTNTFKWEEDSLYNK